MNDLVEMSLLRDLSTEERAIFINEMNKVRKSKSTAILLALFFGGIGAHHYYMGNIEGGVIYTLFCWTFIPGLIAFFELFVLSGRVDKYNQKKAQEIARNIHIMFKSQRESTVPQ